MCYGRAVEPVPSRSHGGRPELVAIGEVVVDLVAAEPGVRLGEARVFERVVGGSVANVAATFSRLGGQAMLVASVGGGPIADTAAEELARSGIASALVRGPGHRPTLAFVTRAAATPEFVLHRDADVQLSPADVPLGAVRQARLVHTSAFALSSEPQRSAIRLALDTAAAAGVPVSLDLNFHEELGDAGHGRHVLAALAGARYAKASRDDVARLLGEDLDPAAAAAAIRATGVPSVAITLGADGAWYDDGRERGHLPAERAKVVDTTGAGDAFWAAVLLASVRHRPFAEAVRLGLVIAARKVEVVGQLEHVGNLPALPQEPA